MSTRQNTGFMSTRQNTRFPSILLPLLVLVLGGCLFDSTLPPPPKSPFTLLDEVNPRGAVPDAKVELFLPVYDTKLGAGKSSAVDSYDPVNVKDYATGKVTQYRVLRQRFGSWSPLLEFRWNYYLLQTDFLFPDKLPDTAGMAGRTRALFDGVEKYDPFTRYFDSSQAADTWNRINSSSQDGALGVRVRLAGALEDTVTIQQVVGGSPAGRAGLAPGMAIVAVNDSLLSGDSAMVRFQRFTAGDSGTVIRLTVLGPAGESRMTLVKEPVAFPSVMVDSLDGVGYIGIFSFTANTLKDKSTFDEFRDALAATRGFAVTVIDLRDNGGGALDLALKMCDEVIASGIIIRELQRRFEESVGAPVFSEYKYMAKAGGAGEGRKFVLMGNGGTASASEIFLSAVREGLAAPLVGEKTYGKGVGQTVRNTPEKGLALVTFLHFTSRLGQDYHRLGLVPDYVDSATADAVLAHAVAVAKAGAAPAGAKISAASAGNAAIRRRARVLEWNRRQGIRPGIQELRDFH